MRHYPRKQSDLLNSYGEATWECRLAFLPTRAARRCKAADKSDCVERRNVEMSGGSTPPVGTHIFVYIFMFDYFS